MGPVEVERAIIFGPGPPRLCITRLLEEPQPRAFVLQAQF